MKKEVRFSIQNEGAWVKDIKLSHVLPNTLVQAIGPFVLLDHISSFGPSYTEANNKMIGKCAQPHRGVIALTYIINGEVDYLDSLGNHVKLGSGGAHWMNAGRGIVHDELMRPEFRDNPNISICRFWINLPSKQKSKEPVYFALSPEQIPKIILGNEAGWIKILSGEYENAVAKVPCFSKLFLYHIHMKPGKRFSTSTDAAWECAAFLPGNSALVNNKEFQAGEFVVFGTKGEIIEIINYNQTAVDIILAGGERYNEPIIKEGTFVMNNPHEITQAYNDYYDGKYGSIRLDKEA